MYKLLVADNCMNDAEALCAQLAVHSRFGELVVECFDDVEAMMARSDCANDADILFMSINLGMADADGIDVVRQMRAAGCEAQVVYVSDRLEHCTRVYQTDHVYFLLKPVEQSYLLNALDKALDNLDNRGGGSLSVWSKGRVVLLPVRKIAYIESDRRKAFIHVDRETLEVYATLSGLAAQLPATFIQCHKSFLVNMTHIVELRKDDIVLTLGEMVPVSQKRRKTTRESFNRYLLRG